MPAAQFWQCGARRLTFEHPLVMGILNVTPDSFSDGGEHNRREDAIQWGLKLLLDGADIIDVGGESTRPGAAAVSEAEELDRVVPVVEALAREGAIISVDTSRAAVMRESVKAGASILNDVRGFEQAGALEAAAETDAGLVVMHGWEAASSDREMVGEGSLVESVELYLRARQDLLESRGVARSRICWDPGFGFGKTHRQNFELLAATPRLVASGQPFLMALSRKSSLGAVSGVDRAADRVSASIAGALLAIERGAQIVRVHDVAETVQAIRVLEAMAAAEEQS